MPTPNDMPGAATAQTEVEEPNVAEAQSDNGSKNGQQLPTGEEILAELDNATDDPSAEIERLRKLVRNVRKYEDRARRNAENARLWEQNADKVKQFEEWQKSQQSKEEQQAARIAELEEKLTKSEQTAMRSKIAAELKVPPRFITGTTEGEMREAAEEYVATRDAEIEARLKALNISPAAPASAVTSDGKGNEVKQLTKADLQNMSRKDILAAEKAGQLNDVLGRSR